MDTPQNTPPPQFWGARTGKGISLFRLPRIGAGGLPFLAAACLSLSLATPTLAKPAALHLPPPQTPARLLKPTPPPAAARTELQAFRQFLPKAFYDNPNFPERYRPYVSLLAKDDYEQGRGYKFDKIIRGDATKPRIALTFDDGPHPKFTLALLDVLRRTQTPATFFVVGRMAEKYPAILELEVAEGNEVGNHTYDHVNLALIPPELIGYELDECDKVIKRATGSSARFFRPPGGDYDGDVIREASKRGYVTTLWTDDPGDFAKPAPDVILKRTLAHLANGSVILLHDGIPQTIQILPALIAEAHKRGFQFVTISELVRDKP